MKKIRRRHILSLCLMLMLSACGQSLPFSGDDTPSSADTDSETVQSIAPMQAPPGMNDRPPLPGQTGRERDGEGLPVMQPARGVNTTLFAEKIRDTDDRFERVENAVLELRQDFDAMLPSLIRLVAIEKDINALVGQLETIVNDPNAAPLPDQGMIQSAPPLAAAPVPETQEIPALPLQVSSSEAVVAAPPAPVPDQTQKPVTPASPAAPPVPAGATPVASMAPVKLTPDGPNDDDAPPDEPVKAERPAETTQQIVQPAAPSSSNLTLKNLRTGENEGNARLVLDLSGQSAYSRDLDETEGLLLVTLPSAQWDGSSGKTAVSSPVIKSWSVEKTSDGKGSLVIVELKPGSKIVKDFTLEGNGSSGFRIVFDIR